MKPCQSTTRKGHACGAPAGASGYCFIHDPARAKERAAARRRGGLKRVTPHGGDAGNLPAEIRTLSGVLALLDYTRLELVAMDNGIARARALISLASAYTEAIKIGELEQRLEALEAVVNEKH